MPDWRELVPEGLEAAMDGKTGTIMVRRHGVTTRLTHWINAAALIVLLMSGLNVFNAHPALYWGQKSTFDRPWVSMAMREVGGEPRGVTYVAGQTFDTTGVFGWSGKPGARVQQGFPRWATWPSNRDLASARRWHFFFAWVFAINLGVYLLAALGGGHLKRDLLPSRAQLRLSHILHEISTHARFQFHHVRDYNVLQKATYLAVVVVLLPLMVVTGLCMSPGFNATVPWLTDLFGGRQSARTIHFLTAFSLVAFVILHLVMVAASGLWNNIRSMITGRYAIEAPEGEVRP
jgi:thiosulfate reductase cytochrome b subunit